MIVYAVPEQVFMAVYGYLKKKPFEEVEQIVNALNASVVRNEIPDAKPQQTPPPVPKEATNDEKGA